MLIVTHLHMLTHWRLIIIYKISYRIILNCQWIIESKFIYISTHSCATLAFIHLFAQNAQLLTVANVLHILYHFGSGLFFCFCYSNEKYIESPDQQMALRYSYSQSNCKIDKSKAINVVNTLCHLNINAM